MPTLKFDPFRFRVSNLLELNKDQEQVFVSILDTFVAQLSPKDEDILVKRLSETHSEQEVRDFCRLSCSSIGSVKTALDTINRTMLSESRTKIAALLSTLATPSGMTSLTGQSEMFHHLSLEKKEKIVLGWRDSDQPEQRALYAIFGGLACGSTYLAHIDTLSEAMHCNLERGTVYENLPERLPMMKLDDVKENMHFDAIVIGSGAGGGVVASQLAKSGKSVLVIEKGKYYHESDLVDNAQEGYGNLYEHGGYAFTSGSSVYLMAGSVFGGGTTVNWSASFKPQHFVREEWAKQGLSHFLSPKFSKDLDTVYKRIGATTEKIRHNGSNKMFMKGCEALGYPFAEIPQNTGTKPHECNLCFSGCRAGVKNGTMNTWLRDAHQHGAKFLVQSKVKKVIIEDGKAVGVECLVHYEKKILIKADCVVVSAGSLQSPGVLLRSGLKNKNIGQHLHIHPSTMIFGQFNEKLRAFEGSLMSSFSSIAEDTENDGYGCKIEAISLQPDQFAAVLPWRGAMDHKESMMHLEQFSAILVLARDKDSLGSVEYDQNENVSSCYNLSQRDKRSIIDGMIRAADIIVGGGGRQVYTSQFGVEPFKFEANEESSVGNERFIRWKDSVRQYGLPDNGSALMSAHQMGTNRMGISPQTSVVKPTGETWEVKDLYVADASVFPTALV
ncbi:unnamed protein product [Rhizopus stolonifer]